MITFPLCKINLGLQILGKRKDGFHDLQTILYPIPFYDALEIIESRAPEITFTTSGTELNIPADNNLCLKAFNLVKKDYPLLPSVNMHLHKTIFSGAGLGGGSADGAFTLKLLNKKFQMGLSEDQLKSYALKLGSDCPFFIKPHPCIARGRGEVLEEIKINLSTYSIVLVNPAIHISTAWAFSQVNIKAQNHVGLRDIIKLPVSGWKDTLVNDFEEPVFEHYPILRKIKKQLYNAGALYASLTGSGATVYGIFEKNTNRDYDFPKSFFLKEMN